MLDIIIGVCLVIVLSSFVLMSLYARSIENDCRRENNGKNKEGE